MGKWSTEALRRSLKKWANMGGAAPLLYLHLATESTEENKWPVVWACNLRTDHGVIRKAWGGRCGDLKVKDVMLKSSPENVTTVRMRPYSCGDTSLQWVRSMPNCQLQVTSPLSQFETTTVDVIFFPQGSNSPSIHGYSCSSLLTTLSPYDKMIIAQYTEKQSMQKRIPLNMFVQNDKKKLLSTSGDRIIKLNQWMSWR